MKRDDTRPGRILLVEDSPADARLTEEALKEASAGADLTWVDDGAKALAYLHGEAPYTDAVRPDLILLDLNMPRLDGRAFLERVKGEPGLASIPVVVLTSSDSEADILHSYQHRANAYITKPANLDAFMEDLKTLSLFWEAVRTPRRGGQ